LTDERKMPWTHFVAYHPDAMQIVGSTGVAMFVGAFLRCYDANMRQPRWDFVCIRCDGSAVRLHPSAKAYGTPCLIQPLIDPPDDLIKSVAWLSRAAPPSLAPQPTVTRTEDGVGFHEIQQQDVIGVKAAQEFLLKHQQWWQSQKHPRPQFCRNMTNWTEDGFFNWRHYMSSWQELRQYAEDVTDFGMAWLRGGVDGPGFIFHLQNGTDIGIDPWARRSQLVHNPSFELD